MIEVNKESVDIIKEAIANGKDQVLTNQIKDLHYADIAELFDKLNSEQVQYIFRLLDEETTADVLLEVDEDLRSKLLASLTSKEIAEQVIENMNSDDAADLIADLPQQKMEEVISQIENAEQANDIVDLLGYDEDTAGGLMGKELVKVNVNWSVAKCIREMRKQAEEIDNVYTVYVINDNNVLLGNLSLKKLLFSATSIRTLIKDIFDPNDLIVVEPYQSSEEVAKVMEKYDLVVLPVVSSNQELLGRITIDDVVDVIKEEADKDYQMASGLSENVEMRDGVVIMTRARLPWLLIGLVGGVLVSLVIGTYEHDIGLNPHLAFFIPLIAAMGGNVGVQSSAIVVQSIANKMRYDRLGQRLSKEFLVALINASICSILIFSYTFFFNNEPSLAYTVAISLFAVIVFAGLFGTIVPLVLHKYKIDPALATGPFITTANDIIGLFIYFMVAKSMYGI
ncbi:MAG: magnesium transporter [Flavobacteriales bacterium]|jgi:magnesium transporter